MSKLTIYPRIFEENCNISEQLGRIEQILNTLPPSQDSTKQFLSTIYYNLKDIRNSLSKIAQDSVYIEGQLLNCETAEKYDFESLERLAAEQDNINDTTIVDNG